METITIIFKAKITNYSIESQEINLGGVFPAMFVQHEPDTDGIHLFKIKKNIPHTGLGMVESVIDEASLEIEHFWNTFEHVTNSPIFPVDFVTYEYRGQIHNHMNKGVLGIGIPGIHMTATTGWFEINSESFHKKYDFNLLKRLNFAKRLPDPISKYLSLYSLIGSPGKESQKEIDQLILEIDPTVRKTASPKPNQLETTFTRLRNEIAHHRNNTSIFKTYDEIKLHLPRFQAIVESIMEKKGLIR